jgi:acyl-CoA thioesterase II
MPASTDELVALLDLEQLEDNRFQGRQPDTALQRVFGGQVASQGLVAAARTVARERPVHSLHAYFLRPGDTSIPIVYEVERLREGRSFSSRRVTATQGKRTIFYLSASFQVDEQGLEHQDPMPDLAGPDECPELGDVLAKVSGRPRDFWDREWAALDVRYAGTETAEDARPVSRVWLRAASRLPEKDPASDALLHAAVLTYASDLTLLSAAVLPHGTYIGDPRLEPASLDHAMWFHRPFRVDEWVLYDQSSPSASGGRGLATGSLFAADGRLVATAVQEGLLRFRP